MSLFVLLNTVKRVFCIYFFLSFYRMYIMCLNLCTICNVVWVNIWTLRILKYMSWLTIKRRKTELFLTCSFIYLFFWFSEYKFYLRSNNLSLSFSLSLLKHKMQGPRTLIATITISWNLLPPPFPWNLEFFVQIEIYKQQLSIS